MEPLLIAREMMIRFYKRIEPLTRILLRFFLGFYIFTLIHDIGYIRPELAEYYNLVPLPLIFILAIAFVVLPLSVSYLIIILDIGIQYSYNIEIAAIVFVFLLCIYLFYARMATKESIFIILTILAYRYGVIYLIPFIAGMYFSVTAIIPVAIGLFIISFTPNISELMLTAQTADLNIAYMPETFGDVYTALVYALQDSTGWVFQAIIFAVVIILVNIVYRMSFDFAKEIAIALGCILMIAGYIMANASGALEVSVPTIIMMTLFCGVIALVARIFAPILDYGRAESVQFEDDTNYYYVRVVPKIQLGRSKNTQTRPAERVSYDFDEED